MKFRAGILAAGVLLSGGLVAANSGVASAFDDTVPWYQRPVTVGSGFVVGNGPVVGIPVVSASGRWVAFASDATNLVPGDTNGKTDLFLRDRFNDVTTRIVEDVDTPVAMSPNGRFITFLAPGELLSGNAGTTRDGIFDRKSGKAIPVPGACAINNDGWFAVRTQRPLAVDLAEKAVPVVAAESMSKLNDHGTISGPFQSHQAQQPIGFSNYRGIASFDASLQTGAYSANLPDPSPYRIDVRDQAAPVLVNMVTGTEKSILDTNPAPAAHPTASGYRPTISPNGRYILFVTEYRMTTTNKVWDTQTGEMLTTGAGYDPIVSNDGRAVSGTGEAVLVSNLKTNDHQYITPFDPTPIQTGVSVYSFATDTNRVLTCSAIPFSRFDTNNQRDCYLLPLPAQP